MNRRAFTLDRRGPVYQQIQRWIERRIRSGDWPEGTRVPPERELAEEFGVARMTVHKALGGLTDQGLLVRQQGSGTYVAPARPQSTVLEIVDLAEEIRSRGHEHSARLLDQREIRAPRALAIAMGVGEDEPLYQARTLHFEDALPVQLEERWVRPAAAPGFLERDDPGETPGGYLLRTVPYASAEHRLTAVCADARRAHWLGVPSNSPLLLLERRTWGTDGLPVTFARLYHPGDRYPLGGRLAPP